MRERCVRARRCNLHVGGDDRVGDAEVEAVKVVDSCHHRGQGAAKGEPVAQSRLRQSGPPAPPASALCGPHFAFPQP